MIVIYPCFSKVKAENGAHVKLLSMNNVSSALHYVWWEFWERIASEVRKLPIYKWIYDLGLMLTLGMQKVETFREVFALL